MSNINTEVIKTLKSDSLQKINQGKRYTHAINVDFSDIGEGLVGRFVFHRPSQMEVLRMANIKSSLLGGMPALDTHADNLAIIISELEVVVDYRPDWFNIFDPDLSYDIMESVYMEYRKWVDSFRKSSKAVGNTGDSADGERKIPVVDTAEVPSTTDGQ